MNPEMLADAFLTLTSTEKAKFFNHLAAVMPKYGIYAELCFLDIASDDALTLDARHVMRVIGGASD